MKYYTLYKRGRISTGEVGIKTLPMSRLTERWHKNYANIIDVWTII